MRKMMNALIEYNILVSIFKLRSVKTPGNCNLITKINKSDVPKM